jgi:hypothetical protein
MGRSAQAESAWAIEKFQRRTTSGAFLAAIDGMRFIARRVSSVISREFPLGRVLGQGIVC